MAYTDLSDEDKIEQSINFVAMGQPIPYELSEWLREVGLYDMIVLPASNEDANEREDLYTC